MKKIKDNLGDRLKEVYQYVEKPSEGAAELYIAADPSVIDDPLSTYNKNTKDTKIVNIPTVEQITPIQKSEPVQNLRQFQQSEPEPTVEQLNTVTPISQEVHIPEPVQQYKQHSSEYEEQKPTPISSIYANDDSINEKSIARVIRILDLYRGYDVRIQQTINQFIKINKQESDLSKVIYGIINVKDSEQVALEDLVSLKEEERTSRAFSLMGLPDNRLLNLRDLVVIFNSNFIPKLTISDRVLYCREIEGGIESLDVNSLKFLKPINEILLISKDSPQ